MVAVLHQIYQQIEYLGLDRYRLGAAAKLAAVGIKRMIIKEKLHGALNPHYDAALKE